MTTYSYISEIVLVKPTVTRVTTTQSFSSDKLAQAYCRSQGTVLSKANKGFLAFVCFSGTKIKAIFSKGKLETFR